MTQRHATQHVPISAHAAAPRLITVAEAADRLAAHTNTVRRAIWDSKLRAVRLGRAIRISETDLAAFIASLTPAAE
jgi:excisionase family DNA binding protein